MTLPEIWTGGSRELLFVLNDDLTNKVVSSLASPLHCWDSRQKKYGFTLDPCWADKPHFLPVSYPYSDVEVHLKHKFAYQYIPEPHSLKLSIRRTTKM